MTSLPTNDLSASRVCSFWRSKAESKMGALMQCDCGDHQLVAAVVEDMFRLSHMAGGGGPVVNLPCLALLACWFWLQWLESNVPLCLMSLKPNTAVALTMQIHVCVCVCGCGVHSGQFTMHSHLLCYTAWLGLCLCQKCTADITPGPHSAGGFRCTCNVALSLPIPLRPSHVPSLPAARGTEREGETPIAHFGFQIVSKGRKPRSHTLDFQIVK